MLREAQIQFPPQSEFSQKYTLVRSKDWSKRKRESKISSFLPFRERLHFISILLESPTNTSRESRFTPSQKMRMKERHSSRAQREKEKGKRIGSHNATDLLRGPPTQRTKARHPRSLITPRKRTSFFLSRVRTRDAGRKCEVSERCAKNECATFRLFVCVAIDFSRTYNI